MSETKDKCDTCAYRAEKQYMYRCNYAGITGRTRKAQPPEECTYYQKEVRPRKEKPTQDKPERDITAGRKYNWSLALLLYDKGKSDGEIARFMNCTSQTVKSWRKRNKLKANAMVGGKNGRRKPMILEEVMADLKKIQAGERVALKTVAGQAEEVIAILLDRVRYLEEKVKAAGR